MNRMLQSALTLLALLVGIFPAGSCVSLAINPHGNCCVAEAPKHTCCNKDHGSHGCQPLPTPSEKMPCCAYMPSHLVSAESTPLLLPAFDQLPPVAVPSIQTTSSTDVMHSCLDASPPDPHTYCPLFICYHSILV